MMSKMSKKYIIRFYQKEDEAEIIRLTNKFSRNSITKEDNSLLHIVTPTQIAS